MAILSMTGFGRASLAFEGREYAVAICTGEAGTSKVVEWLWLNEFLPALVQGRSKQRVFEEGGRASQ